MSHASSTVDARTDIAEQQESSIADEQEGPIAEHSEGPVARAIEKQTAKIPSDVFLWSAGGAATASSFLHLCGRKAASNFIGQWVPSLLILGVYNKIVKTHGHDRLDRGNSKPSGRPLRGGLD